MNIITRDFGELEVSEDDSISFISGMYGFENFKNFIILKENPEDDIMFLQSLDNSDLSFVLVDPYSIFLPYDPNLYEEDLAELMVKSEKDLKFLVIAIIKENVKDSIVNLKSPIAINPKTRSAKQVILQNPYPLRYSFVGTEEEKRC
jgi:flagellar assembly factor FliW